MSEIQDFEFKFKKYASYDDENGEIYRKLKSVQKSPFYQKEMTQVFITSMALGFVKDNPKDLKKPTSNIPTNVFTKQEKWLMISLFMKTHPELGVKSLFDPNAILENAEKYANGGIKFLDIIYEESEDPAEELENEFRKFLS